MSSEEPSRSAGPSQPRAPPESPNAATSHQQPATSPSLVSLPTRLPDPTVPPLVVDQGAPVAAREPRPSFSRALWRIAAADVSSGNRLTLLRDGPSTFDAMTELIDGATATVEYEGYIWRDDEVGQRFWVFRDGAFNRADTGRTARWYLHGFCA